MKRKRGKRKTFTELTVPATFVEPAARRTRAMTLFGQAAVRDGVIFALGMAAIVPVGIVSIAVTTRYLSPAEYGQLAVLFAVASIVTIVCGLGFTTGTMMATYGAADGDDADGDEPVQTGGPPATLKERRRLLGSGLLIICIVSGAVCALVGVSASPLADLLLGSEQRASAVRWMALSAWTGSVWRLTHLVYRMERRPVAWSVVNATRPVLVILGIVVALNAGHGVDGVLMATAAGTAVGSLIAILGTVRCYRLRPRISDIGLIWSYGVHWIPLQVTIAIQGNLSPILLSFLAPAATVGIYQVASRIAKVPTYFGEGFLFAWVPLERAPVALAAKEHKGTRAFEAQVFLLLILGTIAIIVVVTLSAEVLVRIAAPSYRGAASLIPILAVTHCLNLAYRGIYRATGFPLRRWWYTLLHVVWIFPYAGVIALAVGISPTYSVIFAEIVAWLVVCVWMVRLDGRGAEPTPFPWRRIVIAALVAAACVFTVDQLPAVAGVRAVGAVGLVCLFPFLLRLAGVVSSYHLAIVRTIIGSVARRRMRRSEVARRLAAVSPPAREVLVLIGLEGRSPAEAATILALPPAVVCARLVRGLRAFAGTPAAMPVDAAIGEYVANRATTLERDLIAAHLREKGIDYLELYSLDEMLRLLRRPRRRGADAV